MPNVHGANIGRVSDSSERDRWADWVLRRAHAGDPDQQRMQLEHLGSIRDRVLAKAQIRRGDVVLDVGCGDGLIAFGALDFVGEGHVIFSDVSQDLLDHDRSLAEERGGNGRTDFVRASAHDLAPIPDASVDVVTTRSVLIYVADKDQAFREFHRVLRPGGRVSCFEPINNYFPDTPNEYWGFDATPVHDLVEKLWAYEDGDGSDEADPMMNFDEGDLIRHADDAGFAEVHVQLDVDIEPGSWVQDWERLMATAPNPNALTAGESIAGALTPSEAARFETHLRPLVDGGHALKRSAFAYLWAVK